MFCPNCGTKIYENAKFCANCGYNIKNSDMESNDIEIKESDYNRNNNIKLEEFNNKSSNEVENKSSKLHIDNCSEIIKETNKNDDNIIKKNDNNVKNNDKLNKVSSHEKNFVVNNSQHQLTPIDNKKYKNRKNKKFLRFFLIGLLIFLSISLISYKSMQLIYNKISYEDLNNYIQDNKYDKLYSYIDFYYDNEEKQELVREAVSLILSNGKDEEILRLENLFFDKYESNEYVSGDILIKTFNEHNRVFKSLDRFIKVIENGENENIEEIIIMLSRYEEDKLIEKVKLLMETALNNDDIDSANRILMIFNKVGTITDENMEMIILAFNQLNEMEDTITSKSIELSEIRNKINNTNGDVPKAKTKKIRVFVRQYIDDNKYYIIFPEDSEILGELPTGDDAILKSTVTEFETMGWYDAYTEIIGTEEMEFEALIGDFKSTKEVNVYKEISEQQFLLSKKYNNLKNEANDIEDYIDGLNESIVLFKESIIEQLTYENILQETNANLSDNSIVNENKLINEDNNDSLIIYEDPFSEEVYFEYPDNLNAHVESYISGTTFYDSSGNLLWYYPLEAVLPQNKNYYRSYLEEQYYKVEQVNVEGADSAYRCINGTEKSDTTTLVVFANDKAYCLGLELTNYEVLSQDEEKNLRNSFEIMAESFRLNNDLLVNEESSITEGSPDYVIWDRVRASSILEASSSTYVAENVLDWDSSTAWVEGDKADGEGEWIKLECDHEIEFNVISIMNGYNKSEDIYYKNNRVKTIEIELSDGSKTTIDLSDEFGCYNYITFDNTIKTKSIKISILDVYYGTKYSDTCISSIEVY
ncbi:NADase-type glycan-binding domain-containing protein [Clostridium sp. DL1XJH146]